MKHERFWDDFGMIGPLAQPILQLRNVLWKITVWIWDFCRNFFQDEPLAVVLHGAA